jgi:hypothetical protein
MEPKGFHHKLTAILGADAAGYSRLIQVDEAATVKTSENAIRQKELTTMRLRQIVSSALDGVRKTAQGVIRFAKLERVLAAFCLLIPALLICFDSGPIRDSISACYDMEQSQIFYFPLTVASMLFVVNGVVKEKNIYNTVLGVMLAGVILFNHDDFSTLHNFCAMVFFAGNAVVIVVFSSKKERWFKVLLVTRDTIKQRNRGET